MKRNTFKLGSSCSIGEKGEKLNWRIYALFFLILVITLGIVSRLYMLQVVSFSSYRALAQGQHYIFKELVPKRGEMYFKDKKGLFSVAVNKETRMVYAVPKDIEDLDKAVNFLYDNLDLEGIEKEQLREKLNKPDDMYEVIKHRLSEEEIKKIEESKISGIQLLEENYRYYPAQELGANMLGFVGWKGDDFGGRYGLEAYFDKELRGFQGELFQNRDASGGWVTVGTREMKKAQDGDSLILTINQSVQFEAEKILRGGIEKFGARSGSIVVMDVNTGRIEAMANYPTFNPNKYSEVEDLAAYKNITVTEAYEPGSVFKPITMAAALDSGKVSPDSTYTDVGQIQEAGYVIKNSEEKVYGTQTMTQVLEESINTGVIYAEKLLGNKNFADYVERFGFGGKTGISFLAESPGNISNLDNTKSNIQFFTASFGQGISVTPIQLLSAYGALANGGKLMKPQIVEKIIKENSEEEVKPQEVRRVISQKASLEITEMLESVVDNGHGKRAGVPGYSICGKTGTAQVASQEKRGYEEGETIGSFFGYGPAENPRFAIGVRIDDPTEVQWAESSAAPIFGELMKFMLEYYGIEPTREYVQKDLDEFDSTHNLKEYYLKIKEEEREKEKKEKEEKEKDEQEETMDNE